MTYKPKMRISGAGSGGSGSKPHTPREAPNTLQSVVKGRILDLIAYGPIHGLVDGLKSVYLENTPVENADGTSNFEGIKLETRVGLPDQDYIPGFVDVQNTVEVNTEVLFENPPVRSISNNSADAVVVTVQLSALVKQETNGDSVGASVTVLIDYRSGTGAWINGVADTITGKTTSPFPKSYRMDLQGAGPFSIRVRRANAESTVSKLQDKVTWTLLTEVIDKKFTYPNMALVGITVNSKLFGTSMPSRSYDVKLSIISVPSNYDPETRVYTGLWNGQFKQAWTDNPAWAFMDMAMHPVIGAEIKYVDKWLLYRIAQYCDELVPDGYGGMEPRFTINTVFSAEEDAQVALDTLSSVFRGMTYWGTNTVVPVGDMPSTPVKIVSRANVVNGEITYVGTAMSERHSVCTVMWNDPTDADKSVPEIYEDPDSIVAFGWREVRVTAVGCNSRGQALRMAKWILYSERMETQTITYSATLDHANLRPGDIIELADPDYQGARMAGRVTVAGAKVLTLDAAPSPEVLATTSNWWLSVLQPDGTVIKSEVSSFAGNVVTLLTTLPAAPEAGFMWALSATNLQLPQFRVVSNKENTSSGTYDISATEYDPNKYDIVEQGLKLPERPTSMLPTGPIAPPMDLSFEAYTYFAGATRHQGLVISWTPPADVRVDSYVLDVMDPTGSGAFRTVYSDAGVSFDLKDAVGGRWTVRVRSISADGVPSMWESRDIQVAMLLLPVPPDSVRVTEGTFDITLAPQSAYRDSLWEFWRSDVALGLTEIESNAIQLPTGQYLVDTSLRSARTYFYYIRGVNQYGLSTWYATQGTTKADFDDIMDHVKEDFIDGELNTLITEKIEVVSTQVATDLIAPKIEEVRGELADQKAEIDQTISQLEQDVLTQGNSLQGQINQTKADLLAQAADVNGKLTTLGDRIDSNKSEIEGQVTTVKNDLQTQIDAIEQVANSGIYDPTKSYLKGESVRYGQKLYQALQAVPVGKTPPDAAYWLDVGQVVEDSNGLATRVTVAEAAIVTQANEISVNSTSITRLTADLQKQELDNLYQGAETDQQIADALNIAKGAATATESLTATVTQQGDKITAQGQSITEVTSSLSNVTGEVGAQGTAIESLKSVTTAQGNTITSQGASITALNNSLTVTNTNVTAAQDAANAAATLAGGKGKVLVQSTAPVAADQLPQNLWIDTTGNANTPKRWTGSAWTAVTDKVATDAAAAAANALSIANTKADASAVTALTTRVTNAEGVITSQGESLVSLNNSLTITNTNVTAAQNAANAANTLAGGKGKVLVQSAAPAVADQLAQNLWIDTTGNANTPKRWTGSAWAAVTDKVATDAAAAAANALSVANTKADASAVSSLTTRVTEAEGKLTTQGQSITELNNSLVTTNTNVTAAQNAANAANTLAGGKGKVIVQTAAPAVADQLPQNLWIDITGGANTPKRWTGSAWVAVTDKVATDAAAAAANALSVANTKADASAVTSLTTRVTSAEGLLTSQGASITQLNSSLTTTNADVTTAQQAADAANTLAGGKGKVIVQAAVPAVADQLPQNLWIDTTSNANTPKRWTGTAWVAVTDKVATDAAAAAANALSVANTKADATALTQLTTRVTNAEGVLTSQGTSITQLTNNLTVTNTNVTAAQNAANAANTLAGGKGKVIVQSAAPAVADQLAQNLWIDTTGNANTPKRWTGSAWAAVTDKVATDAAAAAANALSVANTKADASALTSLTTRVTSAEGLITSQGTAITQLNNSLVTTNTNVTAAQNAADAANALAGGKGKVLVQTATPAAADQLAQNLWIDITGGANTPKRWTGSAWVAVTDKVATDAAAAAANALSVANTKADASALTSLTTRVTSAEGLITSQGASITQLNNSLVTTNANVTTAQNAANAANTLAGGKGKVLVQSAAPAVADQLAQNLWIDTTGNANTPKRWTGSAWAAVTDKVATDAAAAAANALSIANTKADASALTSLTTRVTSAEGLITSQGTSITQLNNSLTTTNTNVTAAQNAANAANTLAGGKGKVIVQATAPAVADQLVQNLWIDITGGANTPKRWTGSAWVAVTDKVAADAAAAAANALTQVALKADATALTALSNVVTQQGNTITAQGTNLTQLEASLHLQELDQLYSGDETDSQIAEALVIAKGAATATDTLTAGVTQQGDLITAQGQRLTELTATLTGVTGDVGAQGIAIETLKTTTTAQGNTLSSQGESITQLNNSLTVTNTNVTAAQSAANAANTLAGGKGKVIVQSAAPAVADQLAQNLWIDTTGNANTPKRWTGSAWAAVTDKVATDAAAAAANALSVANTKADASALSSLTTRVTNAEGLITAQGASITQLNTSLSTTNTNVTTAQNAANAANTLAGGKGKVLVQSAAPAAADQLVQNLWIDITGGANTPKRWTGSAWAAVTDKVATDAAAAAANALSVANTKADASALTSLTTRVTNAEGLITSQGTSITQLNSNLTITNTNVTTAQNAANAANTLAGGKGKVLVQPSAPAVADQLAQNLWIDTTSNANTPKRWTGSAWAAVTDKVATDAAAAAASALSAVATKADASALTTLDTKVTQQGNTITAQASQLTTLTTKVDGNTAAVQVVANANADLTGKVGAMYAVKLQLNQFGQYVYAGYGLAIEDGPGGLTSTFNINADKFILTNSVNGNLEIPFAVEGGVTYIQSAFIKAGTIDMLKIGDNLQSTDYVAGQTGWKLWQGGNLEFNGSVAGGGRLSMTNQLIQVFDAAGKLRVRMGIWS